MRTVEKGLNKNYKNENKIKSLLQHRHALNKKLIEDLMTRQNNQLN